MNTWKIAQFLASRKGAAGGTVIAVVIAVVIIVAAAIPVTQDVITNQALTGTVATITNQIPTFLALAGLVAVAAMFS